MFTRYTDQTFSDLCRLHSVWRFIGLLFL